MSHIPAVLGLGDNVIDYYAEAEPGLKGAAFPGGNALNVAVHAARLGCRASYLGYLGDDVWQNAIVEGLDFAGVDHSLCPVRKGGCTKVCLYEVKDGERRFLGTDTGSGWAGPLVLTASLLSKLEKYDLIHGCANAKMEQEWPKLASLGAVLTYDFTEKEKYRTGEYLDLLCGFLDLAMFSLSGESPANIEAFAQETLNRGAGHVLVTAGANGQYFAGRNFRIWNPVQPVHARDTMGAGDSFLACLAVELLYSGWKKHEDIGKSAARSALQKASAYASANCMQEGGFGFRAGGRTDQP